MRDQAKAGVLAQLDQHLTAMAAFHDQVDQWIQTDVTVKGDDVAKLLENVAAKFPTTVKQ